MPWLICVGLSHHDIDTDRKSAIFLCVTPVKTDAGVLTLVPGPSGESFYGALAMSVPPAISAGGLVVMTTSFITLAGDAEGVTRFSYNSCRSFPLWEVRA